ncbi:hypothetical protein MYU51_008325 [Penicillium brevicompactum]|uniref:uncharacterized protein n=1 Tax=Penicillium brevicompactum TaxID=5074 RepID=UPI0025405E39|nr:uncharacterized protein N7506_010177 [Penicillium brevicompactum]KAJ5327075.1 hypothetical protein N7506_010177 [Penicillium brevicompactum]
MAAFFKTTSCQESLHQQQDDSRGVDALALLGRSSNDRNPIIESVLAQAAGSKYNQCLLAILAGVEINKLDDLLAKFWWEIFDRSECHLAVEGNIKEVDHGGKPWEVSLVSRCFPWNAAFR